MVICYDCAEARKTPTLDDVYFPFASEYRCPGGRVFLPSFTHTAHDASPSKFEPMDCKHFHPIDFSAGYKPWQAVKAKPDECCELCGSDNVINVIYVMDVRLGRRKKNGDRDVKTTKDTYNLCPKCSHQMYKYMHYNKVDAVTAIKAGLERGARVLARNAPDDGTPVFMPDKGIEKFTVGEALDAIEAPPTDCPICGRKMKAVVDVEDPNSETAVLRYECTNRKCGLTVEVDKGLL